MKLFSVAGLVSCTALTTLLLYWSDLKHIDITQNCINSHSDEKQHICHGYLFAEETEII